ncbi:hypothetical protein HY500_04475 [Candidatus Woesearchaeota archaeon]|nr:hypothetical protein [Candidatus Woesearchaeota archaeon]
MDFSIDKRGSDIYVPDRNLEIARSFAGKVYKEFGKFISGIILFGSVTDANRDQKGDIDILIIIDDVHIILAPEIMETYKIIVEKAILDISKKIHVQTMKLTSFWEYVRAGDPVAVNILRSGVALVDTGFFDPLQVLLYQGRIRPSRESIYTYFNMSFASFNSAEKHVLAAILDLYWSAIDATHAALMRIGEVPPSPEFAAEMLKEKMVKKGYLNSKYALLMHDLYFLSRRILHNEIKEISGKEYDKYRERTEEYIKEIKKFIEKRK